MEYYGITLNTLSVKGVLTTPYRLSLKPKPQVKYHRDRYGATMPALGITFDLGHKLN